MQRLAITVTLLSLLSAGCDGGGGGGSAGGSAAARNEAHVHQHVAPHGGVLLPLGDHLYNIELVLQPGSSGLRAYILDGHAESFVRISATSFEATLQGLATPLVFSAVASRETGETVGNTAQFAAPAAWPAATQQLSGHIRDLEIKGQRFEQIPFVFDLARRP